MNWLTQLIRRLSTLFHRNQFDRDLQEEMELHIDLRRQQHMDAGLSPADARAAANRNFGNSTLLREISSDAWGWTWLEQFAQDLRHGVRTMLRTPGFTATAIIALALGIGANTAIFSVVNAVLLRPIAYKDSARLVTILHNQSDPVAVANYIDWRDQSRSFEAMGAADFWSPNLTGLEHPEHIRGLMVTQNLFPMLGIDPLLGRLFVPGEDQPGAEHEVILSYGLWVRRFQGDRNVLGKPITLNGEAYSIIGVMPASFQFAPFWATHAELWVPEAFGDRIHNRGGNSLRIFARLKPGVSLTQARAEIAAITARLEKQYPGTNRDVVVTPLKEQVVGKIETPLLVLLGAVGFVLLIACANVAHMLLARTAARQKEIAVRAALGARRGRMMRQFLTESLLLAAIGGAAGLLLAIWGTRALVALSPPDLPRLETVTMDIRVMLFMFGITILTGLAFGLAPAIHASRLNLTGSLKDGGRGTSDSVRRNRVRSFLVASEFALALMLLIGAGLMIRSFFALQSIDPGFNPHKVLSMVVSVAGSEEAQGNHREIFYRQLLDRVRSLPGVESAGAINHLPLAGDLWGWSFNVEGRPKPRPGDEPLAIYRLITPGYLRTMQLPVLRGRDVSEKDDSRSPGVVLINERAARRFFAGEDPVGKRITFDDDKKTALTWLTVIGVVKDAKQNDWAADPFPEAYLAALQNRDFLGQNESVTGAHMSYLTLVVRTYGDPAALASTLKNTVWSFDRNLPISEVLTMDGVVAGANATPRFEMLLLGVFAALALILAAVGIYGVMSYSVSRRMHEIGIRLSLGASRSGVLRMIVRQGMTLALAGSAAGLIGAFLLSKLMSKLLYGVRPNDPMTFLLVAAVLCLVALFATYIPARRATRIDPMIALRCD